MTSPQWQHVLQFLHLLRWRKAAHPRGPARADEASLDAEEDRPLGCGWFDSSHDLQHGLQVREADSQALALLPLADWLALQVTPCDEADTPLDAGAGMIADPTLH